MDKLLYAIDSDRSEASTTALVSYALALLFLIHQLLYHFDIAILSPRDTFWNALVCLAPARLVLSSEKRQELGNGTWSQIHAAKSEAMRNALGLGRRALIQQIPGASGVARRLSMVTTRPTMKSDAPPGLGNWDNSCYQNSVLQGLTSLSSLESFLSGWIEKSSSLDQSTLAALYETTTKLRDAANNGRHIWTPAKLKSMSSWQQQDAQEYFSKIMDELDKDMKAVQKTPEVDGLEKAGQEKTISDTPSLKAGSNPVEGLLSQQVLCTACGFTEGLSMIPFNCLTVPLGDHSSYQLQACLDEYTKLEPITDVECTKCSLLKAQRDLLKMSAHPAWPANPAQPAHPNNNSTIIQLPPEIRTQIIARLQEVERALDMDDFSDEALSRCQISKKARVASTKTRQALIGRAPQSLVVHVNRSLFDELTGDQRKNYADVRYPAVLDLGPWILGSATVQTPGLPREDLSKYIYSLKAIVTHYGRHENGHYIAYRRTACDEDDLGGDNKQQWWRLSDEDVSPCSDENVMGQGGVFMLFYERMGVDQRLTVQDKAVMATSADLNTPVTETAELCTAPSILESTEADDDLLDSSAQSIHHRQQPAHVEPETMDSNMSEASTTEDEADIAVEDEIAARKPVSSPPIMMRTANAAIVDSNPWTAGRYITAT